MRLRIFRFIVCLIVSLCFCSCSRYGLPVQASRVLKAYQATSIGITVEHETCMPAGKGEMIATDTAAKSNIQRAHNVTSRNYPTALLPLTKKQRAGVSLFQQYMAALQDSTDERYWDEACDKTMNAARCTAIASVGSLVIALFYPTWAIVLLIFLLIVAVGILAASTYLSCIDDDGRLNFMLFGIACISLGGCLYFTGFGYPLMGIGLGFLIYGFIKWLRSRKHPNLDQDAASSYQNARKSISFGLYFFLALMLAALGAMMYFPNVFSGMGNVYFLGIFILALVALFTLSYVLANMEKGRQVET